MEISRDHHEDDPTTALYQAAVAGSVPSFKNLIQKHPLILNKVSLTHFSETPLHTSALLGHLEFTKALLTHNPRLAQVMDSLRRPPLHLASAEGHKDTVQALLKVYPDACLLLDQDGRTPLHYAAMRGHTEILAELMHAKPESVYLRVLERGDTVFHLCVIYNQLECLKLLVQKKKKLLVEEVGENADFLNARAGSDGGMTILELAVMRRQIQTIRYLLSVPVVREEATAENEKVMKVLENIPRDFVSLEIQQVLMHAGIMRYQRTENEQQSPLPDNKTKKHGKKGRKREKIGKDKSSTTGGHWVEEKRGMLMVVGTMISTMTFQAAINPPGGFWQEFNANTTFGGVSYCSETHPCFAGTAVSSYIHPEIFSKFQTFNTICFLFSLSITLLLISGFPLRKRVLVWLLLIVTCLTLTFLTLTFYQGVKLVQPSRFSTDVTIIYFGGYLLLFWLPLLALVALYHTARFLIWLVKKLVGIIFPKPKRLRNSMSNAPQLAVHSPEAGFCV